MFALKLTLQDASDQYVEYLRSQTHRGADRHAKYVLKMLLLAAQDIEVSRLEGKHIGAFWDVHRYWPRNAAAYRDTISDADLMLAGLNEKKGPVSRSTIRITAHRLLAFFRWLESQSLIVLSPQLLRALRSSISHPVRSAGSADRARAKSISVVSRRPFLRGGGLYRKPLSLFHAISHFQRASKVDGIETEDYRCQVVVMNLFLQHCGAMEVSDIGVEAIDAFISLFRHRPDLRSAPLCGQTHAHDDIERASCATLAQADQVLGQFFHWLWAQGAIRKLPSDRYRSC